MDGLTESIERISRSHRNAQRAAGKQREEGSEHLADLILRGMLVPMGDPEAGPDEVLENEPAIGDANGLPAHRTISNHDSLPGKRIREPERRRGFRVPGGPIIPALSVIFCFLLMAGLPIITWYRFLIWLVIGLVIYFLYSRHRSEFAKPR